MRDAIELDFEESYIHAALRNASRIARREGVRPLLKITLDEAFDLFIDTHRISHLSIGYIETTYKAALARFRDRLKRGEVRFCGLTLEVV